MTPNTNPSAQPVDDGEQSVKDKVLLETHRMLWEPGYSRTRVDFEIWLSKELDTISSQSYQSGYAAAVRDAVACAPEKKNIPAWDHTTSLNAKHGYNEALGHYRTAIEALGDKG